MYIYTSTHPLPQPSVTVPPLRRQSQKLAVMLKKKNTHYNIPAHLERAAGKNRRRHFFQPVGRQVKLSNGYRQRQASGGGQRRGCQERLHDRCRRQGVPPQRQAVDCHACQIRRQRGQAVVVRLDRGRVLESGNISRNSLGRDDIGRDGGGGGGVYRSGVVCGEVFARSLSTQGTVCVWCVVVCYIEASYHIFSHGITATPALSIRIAGSIYVVHGVCGVVHRDIVSHDITATPAPILPAAYCRKA